MAYLAAYVMDSCENESKNFNFVQTQSGRFCLMTRRSGSHCHPISDNRWITWLYCGGHNAGQQVKQLATGRFSAAAGTARNELWLLRPATKESNLISHLSAMREKSTGRVKAKPQRRLIQSAGLCLTTHFICWLQCILLFPNHYRQNTLYMFVEPITQWN